MKYKCFLALLFLLFINTTAWSGQIVIKSIDYKTKQPIPKTFIRLTSIHYKSYKIEEETNSHGIAMINLENTNGWKNNKPSATIIAIKNGYHNKLLPLYDIDLDGHYEFSFPLVPVEIPVLTFTSKISKGFSFSDYDVYIKNLKNNKIYYTKYSYWEISPSLLYAVGEFILDKKINEIEIWVKNLYTKKTSQKYKVSIAPGENKFYFPVE